MGKYRRCRKRLLTSGANLADVPLWEIWIFLRTVTWWLGSALLRLWLLNPFSVLMRRQQRRYPFQDRDRHYCITPPWTERIGDFFRSDESRKTRLLRWVQCMLPRMGVEDFNASWHDGVALCALLEEISPGLCPRPELLKSHHRVNNCRLGIKLAQRYLEAPKMMVTAEEMAIADTEVEDRIIRLVQLLKWKFQKSRSLSSRSPTSTAAPASTYTDPVPVKVVARGTGLKAGIVGRRAKFNILTDSAPFLDLHIEIQGPNNEVNSERITSLNQGLDRCRRDQQRQTGFQTASSNSQSSQLSGYPVTSEEENKSKMIEDEVGNIFLRQKSFDEEMNQNVIPFDYQCVGEGRFLVTYIPRSSGTYFISIKSHDVDIEGSPFEVKVSDWMTSWNVMPKPRVMSFDMLPSIEELPTRERLCPSSSRSEKARDLKRPAASAGLQSSSAASRSASRNSMAQVSRQLTIMKKRVLKRVITRNGEEILLTPSPTLSRQSSADISDMSEDERSVTGRIGKPQAEKAGSDSTNSTATSRERAESDSTKSPDPRTEGNDEERKSSIGCEGREDFSTNTCNITLSVTSFEDDEEAKAKKKNESVSSDSLPALERSKSPIPFKDISGTTYDMTPGMYPSTPKRLARIPESPIHINVRSQLLGPGNTTDAGLYIISTAGDRDEDSNSSVSTRRLQVSPRCLSPSTSDDASGNCSDFTDFDASPRQKEFPSDFTMSAVSLSTTAHSNSDHHHYQHNNHNPAGDTGSLLEEQRNSTNRRMFEETLTHRDRDADDSGVSCSQLVSALTEFNPAPNLTKKAVGRSFSDGAKVIGVKGEKSWERHYHATRMMMGGPGQNRRQSYTTPDYDASSTQTHLPPSAATSSSSAWSKVRSKIIQPDRVRKTVVYINNTSVPTTVDESNASGIACRLHSHSSSSTESGSSAEACTRDATKEGKRRYEQRRLQMKDAQKKWKTFDGCSTVEHEGEWGTNARWRFSLQGKRSHSFTSGWQPQQTRRGDDQWTPHFPHSSGFDLENMSIMDKLNDDDEILEVVIESDEPLPERPDEEGAEEREEDVTEEEEEEEEDFASKGSENVESGFNSETVPSSSSSSKNKFRRNLSRQNHVGGNKSSSDASTDNDRSRSKAGEASKCQKINGRSGKCQTASQGAETLPKAASGSERLKKNHGCSDKFRTAYRRQDNCQKTLPDVNDSQKDRGPGGREDREARSFRTIQKHRRRSRHTTPISILTPKAKIDKCSQVVYSEIKMETGWTPPKIRLHRRKNFLKINNDINDDTQDGLAKQNVASEYSDLKASNIRSSRLSSSKSSSFSDTSLIFAHDNFEFPENVSEGESQQVNGNICFRDMNSPNGNWNRKTETIVKNKESGKGEEGGNGGKAKGGATAEETSHAALIQQNPEAADNSRTTQSYQSPPSALPPHVYRKTGICSMPNGERTRQDMGGRFINSQCFNATAFPPPYSRARSDPQFSRRHCFQRPENAATFSCGLLRKDGLTSRPPRPQDRRVHDWVRMVFEGAGEHEQPERQLTVDTLDSGIENESPVFVSGHRRIHRRPYPWSIDLDPGLIRANAAAAAAVAASSASGMVTDPFSGHRRLSRHPYPWEIDLDPCLIHSTSTGSGHSDGMSSHQQVHSPLTLGGVIEAAVHHTVRQLLSGSSATSTGSHRNFPNISFEEDLELLPCRGEREGGSWSDTELYCKEPMFDHRHRRKRGRRRRKLQQTLTRTSSTVKGDFLRSVAVLFPTQGREEAMKGESGGVEGFTREAMIHRSSPDIAETKSDGRYSPYSASDIPCFELPSDAIRYRHSILGSPSKILDFSHRRSAARHFRRKISQQKSQESTSNDEAKSDTQGDAVRLSLPSSSTSHAANISQRKCLALRRQVGLRGSTSSPERASLRVKDNVRSSPCQPNIVAENSNKTHVYKENESDTNTSEDSYQVGRERSGNSQTRTTAKICPKEGTATLAANPRIVIHSLGQSKDNASSNTSTDESYHGFGISRSQRYDLIDHLKGFCNITNFQRLDSPEGSRRGLSPSQSSADEMYLTEGSSCHLSQYSDPFDDNSPSSLFAQRTCFGENDLEAFEGTTNRNKDNLLPEDVACPDAGRERMGSGSSCGRESLLSPLQATVAHACVNDGNFAQETGSGVCVEKSGRCVAYGAGLSFGLVGEANNFQVWAERPGKGCVTVAIFGPRSHCVTETSVVYIGDNIYDVTYSVTSPGYYVIVVKWGDQSLPDSPYICKVTY